MEWGRNCKGTKWSSSHRISRGWNHRWSVWKQCGTFVRDWRWGLADRISRGDNKLAPERIWWARWSCLHNIRRVSGSKEQSPTLLSNTQSKSLRFNPPKSSHKTYCAWRRVVPPWKSRIWLWVPHNYSRVNVVFSNTGETPWVPREEDSLTDLPCGERGGGVTGGHNGSGPGRVVRK